MRARCTEVPTYVAVPAEMHVTMHVLHAFFHRICLHPLLARTTEVSKHVRWQNQLGLIE